METLHIEINKEDFFKNWESEQVEKLSEEQKNEIIKFFINRGLCLKRDVHKCKNQYCESGYNEIEDIHNRKRFVEVHHVIPRRDFKENPTLIKRLGYECHDLINLITLCKPCHKGYERGKLTLNINSVEYKIEKPHKVDMKALIKEGKRLRKALTNLEKGWGNLNEDERLTIICLLMKWLTRDILHELSD